MKLLPPNREPKELRPRAGAAAIIASALFLLLGARLYHLQIGRGEELSRKSRENYKKELVEPAERGKILDHRGRVLADNRASFDIYLTPAFCKRLDDVLGRLALHLDLSEEEMLGIRKSLKRARGLERFKPQLVKLDISWNQLMVVKTDLPNLEGVDVIESPHRQYCPVRAAGVADAEAATAADERDGRCDGELIAHVVGYMSQVSPQEFEAAKGKYRRADFIGRRGIERALEGELRGIDGRLRKAVDAKGRELDDQAQKEFISEDQRRLPSQPGHNVVLSLDLGLQAIADKAVRENAKAGALVAVDIHTGYVLAMVSHPAYDPNKMTGRISRKDLQSIVDDPLEPLFQRAVQQHYHPGSTFKIVAALSGLENGLTTPETSVSCPGGYSLGARRWRCHLDRGHGAGVNLKRSLQASCDTYYYWVAHKLGLDPIADTARKLGFGATTGIELSPEAPGLMPTVAFHKKVDKHYSDGFALNASIGQGSVNVTPLQLALSYAAIANGGTLYKPRLVRRIESAGGEVLKQFPPTVVRDLHIKPAHREAIMEGLLSVVAEPGGTAYSKRLADVTVAGKTGTAQVVHLGEKRLKETEMEWAQRDHAWFAALAPAEDPEIVVVAINEHGGHGGAAAGPMVMAVVQGYFDIKAREAAEGQPLPPAEIAKLVPNPRFANQARKKVDVATIGAVAPGPVEEGPVSSAAEVADPSLLGTTVPSTAPVAPSNDLELRPSPE